MNHLKPDITLNPVKTVTCFGIIGRLRNTFSYAASCAAEITEKKKITTTAELGSLLWT